MGKYNIGSIKQLFQRKRIVLRLAPRLWYSSSRFGSITVWTGSFGGLGAVF